MRIEMHKFTIEDNRAYLIEEAGHAILVDAPSDDLKEIIKHSECVLDYIFITHEHCDHLWGLNKLRSEYHPMVIATKAASRAIGNNRTNRASVHHIYIAMRFGAKASKSCTPDPKMVCERANIEFDELMTIEWMGHQICFFPSPGHSSGSGMMLIDDEHLFSGDTMLKGQPVFTMFESGDMEEYRSRTLPLLRSFPGELRVYPGHGEGFFLNDYKLEEE